MASLLLQPIPFMWFATKAFVASVPLLFASRKSCVEVGLLFIIVMRFVPGESGPMASVRPPGALYACPMVLPLR